MAIIFFLFFTITLLYALNSYNRGNYKMGGLIYFFFVTEGFHLFPKDVMSGIPLNKITDFAILYLLYVIFKTLSSGRILIDKQFKVSRWMNILFLYITFVFVISVATGLELFGFALQTYRGYFFFLSFIIMKDLSKDDMIWLFKKIFSITLITTILYLQQPLTGVQFTYSAGINEAEGDGLARYRNLPFVAYCFLIYSTVFLNFKSYKSVMLCLSFIAMLILSQHRGIMIGYAGSIMLYLVLGKQFKKFTQYSVIGVIVLLSAGSLITDRFEQEDTSSDITNVFNVDFSDASNFEHGDGTLTFRIFLLYERAMYLLENPQYTWTGVGMRHEDSPKNNFDFALGSYKIEDGFFIKQQISSGDLVWMTPLMRFGFIGLGLYIALTILILLTFWRHFYESDFAKGAFCYYVLLIIISFKNDMLFDRIHLFMVFLLLYMVINKVETKLIE